VKVTKRQLKRIIEQATALQEPMTPKYVHNSLMGKSVLSGVAFMDIAMNAISAGDFVAAADAVMDSLMIDDTAPGDEEELADLLSTAQTAEDVAMIGADWGTRKFRTHFAG